MIRTLTVLLVLALLQGVSVAQEDVIFNPTRVEWNANTEGDLAGYNVYESTISGEQGELLAKCTEITTAIEFTEATPHPDGQYYWVVTAYDTAGNESGPSNEATGIFDSGAPAPPTGCTATK